MRRIVLLTGFEPFGSLLSNPSGDAVRKLGVDPALRASGLRTGILPVHRHEAPRKLAALLAEHRPGVLLLTGVAVGRSAACYESLAINGWRSPRSRHEQPILKGGPGGLAADLPATPVLAALRTAGLRARRSSDAGRFACNLVLYQSLRWKTHPPRNGAPHSALVAFLHLPATPQSLPSSLAKRPPTVDLEDLVAGLRAVLHEFLQVSAEKGHRPGKTGR